MNTTQTLSIAAAVLASLLLVSGASAQGMRHHGMKMRHGKKMVGYDAKDKRYYSVAWAKAHGMHDKGGDPLTIVPLSSLPKTAKESKAMHGAKI